MKKRKGERETRRQGDREKSENYKSITNYRKIPNPFQKIRKRQ